MAAGEASDVVGWLIQEFTLGRCHFLTSAVARAVGRDHAVCFVHPDGRVAHSVLSFSPQYGDALRGYGADILGRRSLADMTNEVRMIAGKVSIAIGDIAEPNDFLPGEEDALLTLASHLPWLRSILRLPVADASPAELLKTCRLLGMKDRSGRTGCDVSASDGKVNHSPEFPPGI